MSSMAKVVRLGRAAGSLAVLLAASWCRAQNPGPGERPDLAGLSVEDLMKIRVDTVYGASRHTQKITEAPASITIITAEDIRTYGYRTLADLLRGVPGFYVSNDRNYDYVAVRGFGRTGDFNSRILILVDGNRMNDPVDGEVLLGTEFPVDVDLIQRVEIIHGPGSATYGSSAFFGVINIITKKGGAEPGLQVSAATASYDTNSSRVTYGKKTQKWEILVSGTLYDSYGHSKLFFPEFNTPETNNGIAENADHDRFHQAWLNISYKDFTLEGAYGSRDKGVPTASFGAVFDDPRLKTIDGRDWLDLGYGHKFTNGFELTAHAYVNRSTFDGLFPYNYSPDTSSQVTLNHAWLNGAWTGEEIRLSKTVFAKHHLTIGNEYQDNFREAQGNFDVAPAHQYLKDQRSGQVWAFYAQDEYSVLKNLSLDLGVRRDQRYSQGGDTSPRAAIIYDPLRKTTLKFLYGHAFRAPNAFESYYQGNGFIPNLDLKPETIRTLEFVAEQYIGERCLVSGSIFENRIQRLISQQILPDGSLQYQNAQSVRTRGAELVFEKKWAFGLDAQINYTWEHAVDSRTGSVLDDSPAQLLSANVRVPLIPKRLTAGLDMHYVSAREALTEAVVPGFTIANLTLFSQHVYKNLDVSASLYNIFNAKYGYPGGGENREVTIYQDGRNMRLKLTYTFTGKK
jgi:outer membrane receptor for ferrienterochelin and colicins